MPDKMKRFILGLLLVTLALGAASSIPTLSSHGFGVSAATVAYADDGCDGPHPPPGLDCSEPTPTPTATPTPTSGR